MRKTLLTFITLYSLVSCGSDVVIPPVPPPDCAARPKLVTFEWEYNHPETPVDGFRIYQLVNSVPSLLSTFVGNATRTGSVQMQISGCLCYTFDATAYKGAIESPHSASAQLCNASSTPKGEGALGIKVEDIPQLMSPRLEIERE